jgi:hypothetical protein
MKNIKEASENELLDLISNKVTIREKYHGTKITVNVVNGKKKYFKKSNIQITIIDTLINDSYDYPISDIEKLNLSDGIYRFTYNHKIGLTSNDNIQFPGIQCSRIIFHGVLDKIVSSMITRRQNIKVFSWFNGNNNLDGFIIDSTNQKFILYGPRIKFPKRIVNEEYYLLMNSVIKHTSHINPLNSVPKSSNKYDIFLQIIDQIFLSTINSCPYDIENIEYGFNNIKVTLDSKIKLLNKEVRTIIMSKPKLYQYYIFLLFLFINKKSMCGNPLSTDKIKQTHDYMYNAIHAACLNPLEKMGFQI